MIIQKLDTTMHRSEIIDKRIYHYNTMSKGDYPGPLDSKKKWKYWKLKFINDFPTLIGVNGVPLYYVMRETTIHMQMVTYTTLLTRKYYIHH